MEVIIEAGLGPKYGSKLYIGPIDVGPNEVAFSHMYETQDSEVVSLGYHESNGFGMDFIIVYSNPNYMCCVYVTLNPELEVTWEPFKLLKEGGYGA